MLFLFYFGGTPTHVDTRSISFKVCGILEHLQESIRDKWKGLCFRRLEIGGGGGGGY